MAAPRLMRSLSPIARLGLNDLNFNPDSQKGFLRAAANRVGQTETSTFGQRENSPNFNNLSSPSKKTAQNLNNFKTAKGIQNDKK